MNLSNIVIAGAPKCGTIAVCNSLVDHQDVGSPREKSLHYGFNIRYVDRPALNLVLRKHLQVEFQLEAQQLAELLGCDLSSWSSL